MVEERGSAAGAFFPVRGWLADCAPEFQREFLALGRPKFFAAGSVVYQAGEAGQDLYGIRSGVILVQCRFTHPDAVLLHMLWAGEWFGTLDWFTRRVRSYTAIARTDLHVLRVPGDEMQALLQRRPEGTMMLARNAVYGLDLAMQTAADLLIHDATARCAAGLLRLADRRWTSAPHADRPAEIPASQAELAMLCNVSRKTFSRVVGDLANRGLVTVGYRSLTVNDPVGLRVVADTG